MRGYHIYNDICVGEMLSCQHENNNRSNPFAVAIIKSGMIVGHLVRKVSSVCSLFLRRNGVVTIQTTGGRWYSAKSVVDTRMEEWVRCGCLILTHHDRNILLTRRNSHIST